MSRHEPTIDQSPDLKKWDDFVQRFPGDVLTQSSMWAEVKAPGYESHRVAITIDDEIVAGCQLLTRRVGPINVGYAAKGPLVANDHPGTATAVVDAVLELASALRVVALILQPAMRSTTVDIALANRGFSTAPINVSTPATVLVDLTPDAEQLLAAMRSSRRRNIRKAEQIGVTVRRGDEQDLRTFHRLHAFTGERQGFAPMTMSYLERQWEVLAPAGAFRVYLAEIDGEPLVAAIVTEFGDRAVHKLAGMSDAPRGTSEYLQWQIILEARERGHHYYDFGGFDRDAALAIERGEEPSEEFRSGASEFKLGFGGYPVVLPQAVWRLSPALLRPAQRPLVWAFRRAAFLRRAVARFRSA